MKLTKKNIIPILLLCLTLTGWAMMKIFFTIDKDISDPFSQKNGMVFTQEVFMQDILPEVPVQNALIATAIIKKETDILKTIQSSKTLWVAIATKENETFWQVVVREKDHYPKLICTGKVFIETGKVEDYKCELSNKKRAI